MSTEMQFVNVSANALIKSMLAQFSATKTQILQVGGALQEV